MAGTLRFRLWERPAPKNEVRAVRSRVGRRLCNFLNFAVRCSDCHRFIFDAKKRLQISGGKPLIALANQRFRGMVWGMVDRNGEARIQASIVEWVRTVAPGVLIYAVPNGGYRSKVEAARLKWTGVVAGIPAGWGIETREVAHG
jgi:hypothetical protein